MIGQVGIAGFQSLKNVMLELGQLTVIVGETDCGKTALYRVLRGFCTNSGGKNYVTDDGVTKDSIVGLQISDEEFNVRLGWRKGESNYYKIGDEKYDKVGQVCPEDVQAILKMAEIDLGGGVKFFPNFHDQFDVPFLQAENGSYIAKVLGEITNINKLLLAVKEAKSRQAKNKGILNIRIADLEGVETKLKDYKELDDQIERLDILKIDCNVLVMDKEKIEVIDSFLIELDRLEKNLSLLREEKEICRERTAKFIGLGELGVRITELDKAQTECMQLIAFEDQLGDLRLNIGELSKEEAKCRQAVHRFVGLKELGDRILAFESKKVVCSQLLELETRLAVSKSHIEKLSDEIENASAAVVIAEGRVREFKKEYKVCPMCGKLFEDSEHDEVSHNS